MIGQAGKVWARYQRDKVLMCVRDIYGILHYFIGMENDLGFSIEHSYMDQETAEQKFKELTS